jgi:hypothetical protein
MGVIWECEGSFPHILLHSQGHEMRLPGLVLAHTLASPCLGHEPNARVATPKMLRTRECARIPYSFVVFISNSYFSLSRSLGVRHERTKKLWHDYSSSSSPGNKTWTKCECINLNYLLSGRNSGCHTNLLCYEVGRGKKNRKFWCEIRIVCTGKNIFLNHGIVWEAIEWPRRSFSWSWTLYRLSMTSWLRRIAF